jgi:mannan endo-1,4-beta-mannosidase
MDRRKFLVWTGLGWVVSSLTAAISSISLDRSASALDLEQILQSPSRNQELINRTKTFYTKGRYLYDRQGNKVILRGVNKMSVWENNDPTGSSYFPEIRKTGANTVRIIWAIRKDLKSGTTDTDLTQLDTLITNAKANRLIPQIELHDATGDWNRLPELVAYWTQPAVINIIKKHQAYLLVNIGNEVGGNDIKGNDLVSEAQFIEGYISAIQTMRSAGIQTPLVIDASDSGKNLERLDATADRLIAADPRKNLLFSVHLYWSISDGADANFIRSKLQKSVNLGYPLIVGEFSRFGGYAGQDSTDNTKSKSMCSPNGEIDYKTILKECHQHEIGWYAWEWGPGNTKGNPPDPLCAVMDMTTDGLFNNIKPGWAKEVAISSPYSIKNTSVTPSTM